ncbi:hypothetical protein [Streptomyces sp. NBC_00096]|uniref:hypothetical protein n=1 Tax=Streptomyces sp. NBC_00096 TaxID=2975650 RepID=UPI0032516CE3
MRIPLPSAEGARVTDASVTSCRRSLPGIPASTDGIPANSVFARRTVAAWLHAHGTLRIPTARPAATARTRATGGQAPTIRFDDLPLLLADNVSSGDESAAENGVMP